MRAQNNARARARVTQQMRARRAALFRKYMAVCALLQYVSARVNGGHERYEKNLARRSTGGRSASPHVRYRSCAQRRACSLSPSCAFGCVASWRVRPVCHAPSSMPHTLQAATLSMPRTAQNAAHPSVLGSLVSKRFTHSRRTFPRAFPAKRRGGYLLPRRDALASRRVLYMRTRVAGQTRRGGQTNVC